MPEGPMNIEPADITVETTQSAEEQVATQQTGLTDVPPDAQPAAVHFPTHQPRLTGQAQRTLNALRQPR